MQSNYPPFAAGSVTIPRMLVRWLDVNPSGSQLDRIQAFLTIPVFNVAYTWNGYSDIVAAFNFEGPNNFSLTSLVGEIPTSATNYTMCIMWSDKNNVTHRYSLIRGVGDNFYFTLTPYSGQLIMKNFRIEIWSTSSATSSQATALQLYTTVKGGLDYRYGNDFNLVNADAEVTNFKSNSTQSAVTFPTSGLVAHWRADTNFSGGTWIDTIGGFILTPAGSVVQASPANLNGQNAIDFTGGTCTNVGNIINAPLSGPAYLIMVAAKKAPGTNSLFLSVTDSGSADVTEITSGLSQNFYKISTVPISDTLATSYPTFRIFQISSFFGSIADVQNNSEIAGVTLGGQSANNAVNMTLGAQPVYIAEIFFYSGFASQSDVNKLFLYIAQRYVNSNLFLLPFTFPSNASPQINQPINTLLNQNPGNYTGTPSLVN